ncbi:hypothetical protein [Halobellus ordinarius]|uniref:hypothetical protein n=1 Tax=Halobellus ordinarius TaxID=3075120 RepID=UPI002880A61A|nr:hypothetical protein [Halobellus sp. ZY16]
MDGSNVIDADGSTESDGEFAPPVAEISAHQSSPDRVVLTEDGNSDGWIAFDVDAAVSLRR